MMKSRSERIVEDVQIAQQLRTRLSTTDEGALVVVGIMIVLQLEEIQQKLQLITQAIDLKNQ